MIPQDTAILLSYINTNLRADYSALDLMCDDLQLDKASLIKKLRAIDYSYDAAQNRFV